ncbi:MAG: ABC transporter permease [Acidimicrobiales bacterium]
MSSNTSGGSMPELHDAHAAMRLGPYLSDLWDRRSYVWYESVSELRSRQVTNVLGNLWHLLNPALNIFVYYLVFGLLLKVDRGVDNFILFLSTGLFVFQLTQKSTIDGARSIISNKGLLKAIKFPRALLPITGAVTEFMSALSSFLVLFGIALLTGESPSWRWFALIPLLVVQFVFNLGASMVAARLTTHFVDFIQILPFFFRLVLYGSGVIFDVTKYVHEGSRVRLLFELNPMYCFITVARWAMFGGELDPTVVVSGIVWSIALCIVGFFFFRAAEERYARV